MPTLTLSHRWHPPEPDHAIRSTGPCALQDHLPLLLLLCRSASRKAGIDWRISRCHPREDAELPVGTECAWMGRAPTRHHRIVSGAAMPSRFYSSLPVAMNRSAPRLPGAQRRRLPRLAAAGTAVMAGLLGGCGWHDPHAERATPAADPSESTAHVQTATNERDQGEGTTAFDQGVSAADIATTREIRKA